MGWRNLATAKVEELLKPPPPIPSVVVDTYENSSENIFHRLIRGFREQAEDMRKPNLTGVFERPHNFIRKLEKKGFKQLGSGAYSTVLAKGDSDRVIKVIRREDGWAEYIKWANDNGYAGKWAPKVYSYKYIAKGGFAIASMERLPEVIHRASKQSPAKVIMDLAEHAANDNELAQSMLNIAAPGLTKFHKELTTKYQGHLDLHGGNYMVRKDGGLVYTDPVYAGGRDDTGVYKTRMKFAA